MLTVERIRDRMHGIVREHRSINPILKSSNQQFSVQDRSSVANLKEDGEAFDQAGCAAAASVQRRTNDAGSSFLVVSLTQRTAEK